MKPIILPYTVKDTEDILNIINFNILKTNNLYDYNPRSIEKQTAIFEEILANGFPVIVAKIDEKVVGFGYYNTFRYREAYKYTVEHSVYVAEEFQGKKIGYLLINELIALAKNQKIHTMIGVIDSSNQNSVDFHKNIGFETTGIIKECAFKFDKWLDTVIMQKIL
jgi:L-amino acid N-acyltransferase YncA